MDTDDDVDVIFSELCADVEIDGKRQADPVG